MVDRSETSEGTGSDGSSDVCRRNFLRKSALTTLAATFSTGCITQLLPRRGDPERTRRDGPPQRSPLEVRDTSIVRADVTPGSDVSGVVGDVGSGEVLVFPSGQFSWSEPVTVTAEHWGIWCQEDTVFTVPPGTGTGESAELLSTHGRDGIADHFHLSNLTFDSPGRAAPGIRLGARSAATVSDLEYRMNGPLSDGEQENGINAYVKDPGGYLEIGDYEQFNNGDLGGFGDGDSRIGIWVGPRNEGTVSIRNPVLQGFPNNACYVSSQPGTVVVEGGLLANNNVSAVRVSGGVTVRDTTIYIDIDRYLEGPGVLDADAHNTRGLWADARGAGEAGGTATGCSLIVNSSRWSSGLVTNVKNPRMTVEECQFLLNADIEGVRATDGRIVVRNCAFDGVVCGTTAGVGDIRGSGNAVAPWIESGDVPVHGADGHEFDWEQTELESSPGRDRNRKHC